MARRCSVGLLAAALYLDSPLEWRRKLVKNGGPWLSIPRSHPGVEESEIALANSGWPALKDDGPNDWRKSLMTRNGTVPS